MADVIHKRSPREQRGRKEQESKGTRQKLLSVFFLLRGYPPQQRRKNLGSRVALLPRKFLRVRKVFARITEKTFIMHSLAML